VLLRQQEVNSAWQCISVCGSEKSSKKRIFGPEGFFFFSFLSFYWFIYISNVIPLPGFLSPQTSLSPCISVPSVSMKLLSHRLTDSPASSRAFPYAELSSLSFLRRLLTATAQVCDAFPAVAGLAEGRVKQRPRPRRRRRGRGGGGGGNETVWKWVFNSRYSLESI
jgi:hypothetical protein